MMGQTAFCRVVACAQSQITFYRCFTSDLGSGIIRLYDYPLLSMRLANTHVIGLFCCQDIVLVGIISIGAALTDTGISAGISAIASACIGTSKDAACSGAQ